MKARLIPAVFVLLGAVTAVSAVAEEEPRAPMPVTTTVVSEGDPTDELLIRRERYFYSSFARRDPFSSLIKAGSGKAAGELLDIGELSLRGVVWGESDKFAVVEDQRTHVHVLREGDRVVNGKVTKITNTDLTVQHYFFGETANVTIQLQGAGE